MKTKGMAEPAAAGGGGGVMELDYRAMSRREREDAITWLKLHDVDPNVVPAHVHVDYDAGTDEWIIPVFVCRDGKLILEDGDVKIVTVRRKRKADLK